jgi:hypothetical protein
MLWQCPFCDKKFTVHTKVNPLFHLAEHLGGPSRRGLFWTSMMRRFTLQHRFKTRVINKLNKKEVADFYYSKEVKHAIVLVHELLHGGPHES